MKWVAGAGPAATTVTVASTNRREAPDERGEALNCGWGIAAMAVPNQLLVALAAPAASHPDGREFQNSRLCRGAAPTRMKVTVDRQE